MYAVVAAPRELPTQVQVFGPFRTQDKAEQVATMLRDPGSVEYYGDDEWDVYPVPVQRPE